MSSSTELDQIIIPDTRNVPEGVYTLVVTATNTDTGLSASYDIYLTIYS